MFIKLKGRVTKQGKLEVDLPDDFPTGEVWVSLEHIDPEAEAAEDARWDESFAKSQDLLTKLAREARAEDRAGLTEEFDPDVEEP